MLVPTPPTAIELVCVMTGELEFLGSPDDRYDGRCGNCARPMAGGQLCLWVCAFSHWTLTMCQHSILRTLPYVGPRNEGTGLESFGNLLGVLYPIVVMSGSKPWSDPRPWAGPNPVLNSYQCDWPHWGVTVESGAACVVCVLREFVPGSLGGAVMVKQ